MNRIIELETKKLKLITDLNEQKNDNSLLELIYLNSELNKEYHKFYNENPFIFIQTFNNLENQYKENTYIDTMKLKDDKLISYGVYLRIRKIMYTNPKYQRQMIMNNQMSNVYIDYFNQVRKNLSDKSINHLRRNFLYVDNEFAEHFLFKKSRPYLSIEDKLASDHLRTVECRKIQERLISGTVLNNKFYIKSIEILMNQLVNTNLKSVLQEELDKIILSHQIETYDNIVPIYKKMIKTH